MSYIKNLAAILHKAQGVIDPETRQPIDIGGEVLSIRQEADKMRAAMHHALGRLGDFKAVTKVTCELVFDADGAQP